MTSIDLPQRPDGESAAVERAENKMSIEELREAVRTFMAREVPPARAAEIDEQNEFPLDLWPKLGEAGLLGVTVSEEKGGQGLTYRHHTAAMEEVSRASGSVGLSYGAHSNLVVDNIFRNGTPEQLELFLAGLLDGSLIGGLCMTEPDAGSDAIGSMQTHAEQDGDDWIMNGSKAFITNAPEAGLYLVYSRTGYNEVRRKPLTTAFLLPRDTKGLSVGKKLNKMGMRGSNTAPVFFDDCRIPAKNVLGDVNKGSRLLADALNRERIVLAGGPLGLAKAAAQYSRDYALTRKQFGQPIASFQLIQEKLALMYSGILGAEAIIQIAANIYDRGGTSAEAASAAIMNASSVGMMVTNDAVQILGGNGYIRGEYPVERMFRDAKLYDIGAGTQEIRKLTIAGGVLAEGFEF